MLPEDIDAVTASYHRCMHGEGFVDTFYERFLAKSPEVAIKFQHTDFSSISQPPKWDLKELWQQTRTLLSTRRFIVPLL